jgi:hypothetical protein
LSMEKKSPIDLLQDVWRAVPLKLVLLLIVLSLTLKNPDGRAEYYPFSNYPMYSQFDESDYFVYLADQDGEPLPSKETFRITTPKIKKRFKKELGAVAKRLDVKKSEVAGAELEAVAVTTLRSLDNAVPDHPRVAVLTELQLIYVDLRREGGEIVVEERKIGSIER